VDETYLRFLISGNELPYYTKRGLNPFAGLKPASSILIEVSDGYTEQTSSF
jgi:hypothetical protein